MAHMKNWRGTEGPAQPIGPGTRPIYEKDACGRSSPFDFTRIGNGKDFAGYVETAADGRPIKIPPRIAVHKVVRRIKGRTSHDLRAEFPWLRSRIPTLWTNSYFVSTVGGAPLEAVERYIQNQKTSWRESQKGKMG